MILLRFVSLKISFYILTMQKTPITSRFCDSKVNAVAVENDLIYIDILIKKMYNIFIFNKTEIRLKTKRNSFKATSKNLFDQT